MPPVQLQSVIICSSAYHGIQTVNIHSVIHLTLKATVLQPNLPAAVYKMCGIRRHRKAPSRLLSRKHLHLLQADIFASLGQKPHSRGMMYPNAFAGDIL